MRNSIIKILRWQAIRYINKFNPRTIVVTGSVGKTSTTQSISTVLSEKFIVRTTLGNYNSEFGVPCSIFSNKLPSNPKNPLSWMWLLLKNQSQLLSKPNYDMLVLELGTDAPGDISAFSWLKPEIAVVTAIAEEHMEFFKSLDEVAKEELSVGVYSEKIIINKMMVDLKYLKYIENDQIFNYSRDDLANVKLTKKDLQVVADHSIDAIAAAIAVGRDLGMSIDELARGAKSIKPLNGRMQILDGIRETTLIDDTYNASPAAVKAALDYLYSANAPQRIALLGNMNELGDLSKIAHEEIGAYCDPKKLDLVVTLGPDANKYTSKAAKERGCFVIESSTPYEAADTIKEKLNSGAIILLKGSQNRVFAEEATKLLLENKQDINKLVRQSSSWLKIKENCFKASK